MQGNKVCQSIVDALDLVAEEIDRWDVVVIIRGGGAVSDLGGFDNYELAFNVAQFPLPVLTGIGHGLCRQHPVENSDRRGRLPH